MLTDELTTDQIKQMALDAEQRVGYRLSEVLFPVNPLLLPKTTPTEADIVLLKQWASASASASASVGGSVWAYIGSLFPTITKWEYVNHTPGVYPFQSAVDLWRRGLVPSYSGGVWRLHSGAQAEIVWEEK